MMTDEELAYLIKPILEIYRNIEMELLIDVAHRFDTYDTIGGTLEWRLKKLDDLGALNASTIKIIAKHSKKSEASIKEMIKKASLGNFKINDLKTAFEQGRITLDLNKMMKTAAIADTLNSGFKEIKESIKLIETSALESTKQYYMDIINRSYIEVSSGIYSYSESIQRAVKKMAAKGITGATYKRKDGSLVRYGIESCVRRDALTAVNRTANNAVYNLAKEMGCDHVEVSSHLGARVSDKSKISNHAGWQGKVYKIHGSDNEYKNLVEETGYGGIEGLAGVNCRHRMFPFFAGISTQAQVQHDNVENHTAYELSQKQRSYERSVRNAKKEVECMKAINNPTALAKAKIKQERAVTNLLVFLDKNGLRRDGLREQI